MNHGHGLQDKQIGKRVLSISGTVPAANYVILPKKRSQSLGLTGQFLYLQVRRHWLRCEGIQPNLQAACERTASSYSSPDIVCSAAQVQVKPNKDWVIHVEATDVVDKVHRLSLSNIYKAEKAR